MAQFRRCIEFYLWHLWSEEGVWILVYMLLDNNWGVLSDCSCLVVCRALSDLSE